MGQTKQKLKNGEVALGAWIMIGHIDAEFIAKNQCLQPVMNR